MNAIRLEITFLLFFILPMFMVGAQPGWVVGWGYDVNGQATGVASGRDTNGLVTVNGEVLTDIVAISAGGAHNLALKKNGTVVAWGDNRWGESTVPVGLSNVVAISASSFSMALKKDGTVVSWGAYDNNLPTGLSNVLAIAEGLGRVLVLKHDGTVVGWGQIIVPANLTNIIAIDCAKARFGDNLALKNDGTVASWGPYANSSPGLSNIVAIAAGTTHSLALKGDGTLAEWNTRTNKPQVVFGLSNVVAIATAGESSSMALKNDRTVVVWGENWYNQTNVPVGLSNVVAIADGGGYCLAITTNPAVADKFRQK